MTRLLAPLVVGLFATLATPTAASACSPAECGPGILLPRGGTIPQNAPGMYWQPFSSNMQRPESQVHLFRITGSTEQELDLTIERVPRAGARTGGGAFVVRPVDGWVRGARYRAEAPQDCAWAARRGGPLATTFEVARRARLPRSLGTLTVTAGRGQLVVRTWRGTCSEAVGAVWNDIALALSRTARPWRELLLFRSVVDGLPWRPTPSLGAWLPAPGESWVGRGQDRMFSQCRAREPNVADRGLPLGDHRASMSATLPGTEVEVETTVVSAPLVCPAP